jgi:NTP pyrophosphatase (non-canonical NTP hydrolase)
MILDVLFVERVDVMDSKIVLSLPRLDGIVPTFESTMIKMTEEVGEVAQLVGKHRCMSKEDTHEILSSKEFVEDLAGELIDVAQSAVSFMFVLSDMYGLDIDTALIKHKKKLVRKGYLKGDDKIGLSTKL